MENRFAQSDDWMLAKTPAQLAAERQRNATNATNWATPRGYQTQLSQADLDGFRNWYGDQIRSTFSGQKFTGPDNYNGLKPGALRYGGSNNYFQEQFAPKVGLGGRERDVETDESAWSRLNAAKAEYQADPDKYIRDQIAKIGQANVGHEDNQHLTYDMNTGKLVDMSNHNTAQEGMNQVMPVLAGLGAIGGLAAAGVGGGIDLGAFGGGLIGGSGTTAALPASEVAAMTPTATGSTVANAAAGGTVAGTGAGGLTGAELYFGAPGYTGAGFAGVGGGAAAAGSGGLLGLLQNSGGIIGKIASGNAGIGDYIGAAGLLGDVLGIGGKDKNGGAGTTNTDKTPWGPAQGFILRGLADTAALNDKYKANPMSPEMQKAYQNQAQDTDFFRNTMMPNMMNFAAQGIGGGYQRGGSVIPGQQMYTMQQSNPAQDPRYNMPTKGAGLLDSQYNMPKSSPPAGWKPPYDPNATAGDWSTHFDPNAVSSIGFGF